MNSTSGNTNKTNHPCPPIITRRRIIIASCALIIAGYLMMSGSGSTEQSFNPDIFSTRRIVIAPIFCLTGYLLMIVGILHKKRSQWE